MRRLRWLSILLLLPWAAWAGDALAPGEPALRAMPAIAASAEAVSEAEPMLDLSIDPILPAFERTRPVRPLAGAKEAEPQPQAPLSFGLDLRTRREVGNEARQIDDEPPGIGERVEGIVRRSTIGVTGTYRF